MSARAALIGAAVAVLCATGVLAWRASLVPSRTFEALELETLDWRFRLRGAEPASESIVLLAMDDRTLEQAPELYERRAGQARVITAAKEAGAKVLGVDVVFADPERLLDPALVAEIDAWMPTSEPSPARELLARVQQEVHGDDALVAAIQQAGNVVLAFHAGSRGNEPTKELSRGKYGQVSPGPHLPDASERVLASHPMFSRAAARLGAITTYEDVSGSVREIPIALRLDQSLFVPMALQLVAMHEDVGRASVAFVGEDGTARVGDRVIGGDRGRLILNWRGAPYRTVSVIDLVNGEVAPDALQGRIAILGFTHLAQDVVTTPFGRRPGYEVHATAVDNVLAADPLRRAPAWLDAALALGVGLLVTSVFVPRRVSPAARMAGATAIVLAALVAAHVIFAERQLWVSAIGPAGTGLATGLVCLAAAYLQEGMQRRYLRSAFAHYLSDELVEELVADPSRVSLTGDRRELTVLFTDIRDFTTFSERLAPLDLAEFLKEYFGPMTRAVLDNSGYVDKFIGDAVMAIFGAPVRHEQHASEACEAAIDMHAALDRLRPVAERYGIELAIGAGINTGEMVVGNLGSAERFDYTVLGDAVNLASRLEGLTKTYGVFCLVGERARAAVRPGFTFRPVDLVRVKGKGEPVAIYELCAGPNGTIVEYLGIEGFAEAVAAFRIGDFVRARQGFERFCADNPADPLVRTYLARLDALAEPPPGWDGVFVHTKK